MSGGSNNISRSVWSEVIRQVPSDDPNKAGQLTFEDPDLADARMSRAVRAEGELLFIAVHRYIILYDVYYLVFGIDLSPPIMIMYILLIIINYIINLS